MSSFTQYHLCHVIWCFSLHSILGSCWNCDTKIVRISKVTAPYTNRKRGRRIYQIISPQFSSIFKSSATPQKAQFPSDTNLTIFHVVYVFFSGNPCSSLPLATSKDCILRRRKPQMVRTIIEKACHLLQCSYLKILGPSGKKDLLRTFNENLEDL